MTADAHLSPSQFGFHPVPEDEWNRALERFDAGGVSGRIDPNTTLHTGQQNMWPSQVEHYASPGNSAQTGQHSRVEIYHMDGKQYVGDGHHRLAAARARGSRSIRVTHYGK